MMRFLMMMMDTQTDKYQGNKFLNECLKVQNITIPGSIMGIRLGALILGITMGLFTVLPVRPPSVDILGESTFGRKGNQRERVEELQQKATGKIIMDLVQN